MYKANIYAYFRKCGSFFLLWFVLLAFWSCVEKVESIGKSSFQTSLSEEISYSDAIQSLQEFMEDLNATKSGQTQSLADTSNSFIVQFHQFKSAGTGLSDKRLFYVVDFGEDDGYAILAANKKLGMEVICLTEKGHLTPDHFVNADQAINGEPSDTTFIPEAILSAAFLRMANAYAPLDPGPIGGGPSGVVAPLLKTKWGQKIPFNTYIPGIYTGCVPTALAQIMAYEEYSSTMTFDGVACSWSEMKTVRTYPNIGSDGTEEGKEQVAHFLKELGNSNNCQVTYGPEESGAYDSRAKITLENFGYSNVSLHFGTSFNNNLCNIVNTQLLSGHPAYVSGTTSNNGGHAWVVDGYYLNTYHINWGWYGAGDGYYNIGVFDQSQRTGTSIYDTGSMPNEISSYIKWFYVITYDIY